MFALVYNNNTIRDRGEKLNLTDMWRAAGADDSKRPYEWCRKEGSQFIAFLSETLNTPIERILTAERGRDGATWAHWQMAMAYAKYLSHEFHAWCNEVVRAHMEGRAVATPIPPPAVAFADLFAQQTSIKSMVERIDGNVAYLRQNADRGRKDFPAQVQYAYLQTVRKHFGGLCPCCAATRILDASGNKLSHCHFEHWYSRDKVGLSDGWATCSDCNQRLEDTEFWDSKRGAFEAFQRMLLLDRCPLPRPSFESDVAPVRYTKQPGLFDRT